MDKATLGVFGLFSGSLGKKAALEQYEQNTMAWLAKQPGHGGKKAETELPYIEKQWELTWLQYGKANALERKLFFGGRELTAAENAWEVIAVYNALLALGQAQADAGGKKQKYRSLPDLLYQFAKKGICLKGIFGTNPKALEKYFREYGYRTASCTGKRITKEALAALQQDYDTFIMTAFNEGQNPFAMVHTMSITKEKNGYRRHNDYEKVQFYETLYDAVRLYHGGRGHTFCVIAVGIHEREGVLEDTRNEKKDE